MEIIINLQSSQFVTVCGREIDSLKLAQAKMHTDPAKTALKLLSCLFTQEELVNGNPRGITNSKDQHRIATIQPLETERMAYINGKYTYIMSAG